MRRRASPGRLSDAIVVGSGPNGLACAVELARDGVRVTVLEAEATIGGGTRTSELTVPGLLHDDCSATHPMAVGVALPQLARPRGARARVALARGRPGPPARRRQRRGDGALDRGDGAGARRGRRDAWRRVFGSSSAHFDELLEDVLRPILHVPRHPLRLIRFGIPAAAPATLLARSWKTPQARALFGGVAAHAFSPLDRPMSSSVGCALIDACHAFGWPVAKGGSRAITDALASVLREHGGRIETGRRVGSLAELGRRRRGRPRPRARRRGRDRGRAAAGAGRPRVPPLPPRPGRLQGRPRGRGRRARGRTSPAGGPGPSTWPARSRRSSIAERAINRGSMPERPFVLVGQQYLADPSRSEGDLHPVWVYAHVPNGYAGDASETILGQIERFAPGFRERIVASSIRDPGRPGRLQRQLRRRRHHHRGQHAGPGPDQAALRARSLQHRHRRRLHLLGRDAAGSGRPRHERVQRRPLRAAAPRLRRTHP